MDVVLFDNYEIMAAALVELAQNTKVTSAVVCKYKDAIGLIRAIIGHNEINIKSLGITDPEFNGYEKEYLIDVTSDMELWIEPLDRDDGRGYLKFDADIIFVTGDSNSGTIKCIKDKDKCYETYFGELPEEYDDEEPEKETEAKEDDCAEISEMFEQALSLLENICEILKM